MDRRVKAPGSSGDWGDLSDWKELLAVSAAVGLGAGTHLSMEVGESLYGSPQQDIPWNPISLALQLATGNLEWTTAHTGGAVTLVAGAVASVAGTVAGTRWACGKCRQLREDWRNGRQQRPAHAGLPRRAAARVRQPEQAIDAQARFLARAEQLTDLTYWAMVDKAAQLGVDRADTDAPGVSIGEAILDPRPRRDPSPMLYGSYEDLHLDLMGPRGGKSSRRVIPAVMEALGPVVATSNKRDVVDATREHRAALGDVKVFDPQGVADEACTWYWDPIEWVAGTGVDGGADAQLRAAQLAGHFAAGGDADKRDAFFDPEGEDLVAGLILAAAVSKKPITQVFRWVTDPFEEEPVDILRSHDYEMVAAALNDQYNAPDRQRAGIFSTAKKMVACLKYDRIHRWVTPPKDGEQREPFDVRAFATSRDTLYPLSLEGKGTAGPLITALTAAVVDAASREGVRHGGRLPVPMLAALDEAANIVKWPELPKMYSHFGSRGIVVMTILQSWAQGVRCWGEDGMKALFSAANVKVLGAGLADAGFLRDVSELVGQHYEVTSSVTKNKGKGKDSRSSSTSWSRTTETTLTASDLAAMGEGRALVLVSKHRPVLVRLVPWWERPYADAVKASIARHDPAKNPTRSTPDQVGGSAPSTDPDTEGDDA
ncbi:type IV secretory system conjugative DNA transfer family protein [Nocardia wallacei]|uniref:type IV secretory system conjugative DNA transfer family protein n=1 Tax=Nocardia wallacei TaxID=480035 RepID=UPI002458070F|nr:TraM recognition domain-containing protein [Nocardia wallacei]